jgi:hypothetical protein
MTPVAGCCLADVCADVPRAARKSIRFAGNPGTDELMPASHDVHCSHAESKSPGLLAGGTIGACRISRHAEPRTTTRCRESLGTADLRPADFADWQDGSSAAIPVISDPVTVTGFADAQPILRAASAFVVDMAVIARASACSGQYHRTSGGCCFTSRDETVVMRVPAPGDARGFVDDQY